ncbi:MAG: AraC family transcriptional regulator [Sphingobacteriales bacterium]|nr:AraC family transcriptional regulator [Sphingobacteriales bacterium]
MLPEIRRYKFKSSATLQIEVLPLEKLVKNYRDQLVSPHRTDFYHIFLLGDCSPVHLVDFNPVKTEPYSLLFVDKDRVQQFDPQLKYSGCLLLFTDDFFSATAADTHFLKRSILFNGLVDQPAFGVGAISFRQYVDICQQITKEQEVPADPSTPAILRNWLHNFLLLAEREKRKQGFSGFKKSRDLDYMLLFRTLLETGFTRNKSVGFYADSLHISEKRLGQASTKILGKHPKEMIDDRVLLEAKRMLVYSHQSAKEIGFALGFEEPTNFIKYFRRHTGLTPLAFRKKYC